jgi:hypothetical protein
MTVKNIQAVIKGQTFVLTYDDQNEDWIKSFCGCTIKNNMMVEIETEKRKKKGNRNVIKARKSI